MSEDEGFLARWSRLKREQGTRPSRNDAAPAPPELEPTPEELRSAWRTDPAIREFVEMADNQWDFNTPEAIPGFGDLGATAEARELIARAATGAAENTATMLASLQPGNDRPESQVMSGVALEDSRVVDPVWRAGVVPLANVEQASAETPAEHPEPDTPLPSRRLHGSALPK